MTRYVVGSKPGSKATRIVKKLTRAKKIVNYRRDRVFSRKEDFFIGYPPVNQVLFENPEQMISYHQIMNFFSSDKKAQRKELARLGMPVPETVEGDTADYPEGTMFIRRPRRHSAGVNYKVLTATEVEEEYEDYRNYYYYSVAYKKKHEYRIIILKGKPIYSLIKKVPEGTNPHQPWNHAQGARFQTVRLMENNRLRNIPIGGYANIFEFMRETPFFLSLDFGGLDIMLNKNAEEQPMQVLELNFCPSMDIPENQVNFTQSLTH
tara:strand:+ start:1247 stop:2038 length:792 start_codon:yes stop_codon:yes gene_type:complete